jgi:hypothetical protein
VIQVVGWAGSVLLVVSLLQTRVLRFRVLNLVAAVVLVAFNAVIAVWPMAAMNLVIAGINAWHVVRLLRTRHDAHHYAVLPIGPDEPYLRHLLHLHRRDIERFNPGLLLTAPPVGLEGGPDDTSPLPLGAAVVQAPAAAAGPADRLAFLVQSGGETVGLVLAHRTAPGTAQVDLDYVLPRFRDFTPGEFVFRPDGPFAAAGISTLVAPRGMQGSERYLGAVGFLRRDDDLVLELR